MTAGGHALGAREVEVVGGRAARPLRARTPGVAARAGVDPAQVHQFLPSVMGLLEGHSQNASAGVQGMLGGLMSSLQGSPMSGLLSGGGASGGGVASEVLGLAKGLLG